MLLTTAIYALVLVFVGRNVGHLVAAVAAVAVAVVVEVVVAEHVAAARSQPNAPPVLDVKTLASMTVGIL